MASYGRAKQRDMIRSILPSKSRKGARDDKRIANKRARHRVSMACRTYAPALRPCECEYVWFDELDMYVDVCGCQDSVVDKFDVELAEADFKYNEEIKWAMWDRRIADKTAPIERWMVAKTAHVRREDRESKAYAILPDNTIGRHAASHVVYLPEFTIVHNPGEVWWFRRDQRRFIDACRYAAVVDALKEIASTKLHVRFNEIVGAPYEHTVEYSWRFRNGVEILTEKPVAKEGQRLKDADDVEDFLERCRVPRAGYGYHTVLFDRIEKFLKEHGFDIPKEYVL